MAIQTLRKTRLRQCSEECSVEDTDSSIHIVEVLLQLDLEFVQHHVSSFDTLLRLMHRALSLQSSALFRTAEINVCVVAVGFAGTEKGR